VVPAALASAAIAPVGIVASVVAPNVLEPAVAGALFVPGVLATGAPAAGFMPAAFVPAAFVPAAACAIRPPAWAMSGIRGASGILDAGRPMRPRECIHDLRIELNPGELPELGHRLLARQRRQPVGARRRHRLEGVGHVEDPRQHRDLVAHQAVRIARAVVPLVVVPNDRQLRGQLRHRGDDVRADHRVRVHDRALFARQEARLVEDAVRNADLPDVVEQPAPFQGLELLLGPSHHAPDVDRDLLDPLAVSRRPVATCVNRLRQARHRLREHLAHLDDLVEGATHDPDGKCEEQCRPPPHRVCGKRHQPGKGGQGDPVGEEGRKIT
jgi:hypothetical protein